MSAFSHESVMVQEVIGALEPHAGGLYADATVGGGGHAEAILRASSPDGRVLGIDRDPTAVTAAKDRLAPYGDRATLVHAQMGDLPSVLCDHRFDTVDGIVVDLGVSSHQFDTPERGFSFSKNGPLDMRMDPTQGETALELIRGWTEAELANVIFELGEERRSRAIARSIRTSIEEGSLESTGDLRHAVLRATGPHRGGLDPSTRTFQALRLAVNRELEELESFLSAAPDLLREDGVVVVISFHSLEDRRVKHAFRDDARLVPLTRKPAAPSLDEHQRNPRARSAKLRAARRASIEAAA